MQNAKPVSDLLYVHCKKLSHLSVPVTYCTELKQNPSFFQPLDWDNTKLRACVNVLMSSATTVNLIYMRMNAMTC